MPNSILAVQPVVCGSTQIAVPIQDAQDEGVIQVTTVATQAMMNSDVAVHKVEACQRVLSFTVSLGCKLAIAYVAYVAFLYFNANDRCDLHLH